MAVLPVRSARLTVPPRLAGGLARALSARRIAVRAVPLLQLSQGYLSGSCDAACRRELGGRLRVRYLVGGTLELRGGQRRLTIWLADGRSGARLWHSGASCDRCDERGWIDLAKRLARPLRRRLAARAAATALYEIDSRPTGAQLAIDGRTVGSAPRTVLLAAGDHRITARHPGYLAAERRIEAVGGVSSAVTLRLIAEGRPVIARRTIGWLALAAGAAAVAAGVTLLAIHGQKRDCGAGIVAAEPTCQRVRHTATGGWLATAGGAAAITGGLYLLLSHTAAR